MMVGVNISDEQLGSIADRTIQEADTNGDNSISFNEFIKVGAKALIAVINPVTHRLGPRQPKQSSRVCNRLDSENNLLPCVIWLLIKMSCTDSLMRQNEGNSCQIGHLRNTFHLPFVHNLLIQQRKKTPGKGRKSLLVKTLKEGTIEQVMFRKGQIGFLFLRVQAVCRL